MALEIHPEGSHELTFDHVRGKASGWSVYPDPFGSGWRWTAYGPRGGNASSAPSKEQATQLAKRSAEDLCR